MCVGVLTDALETPLSSEHRADCDFTFQLQKQFINVLHLHTRISAQIDTLLCSFSSSILLVSFVWSGHFHGASWASFWCNSMLLKSLFWLYIPLIFIELYPGCQPHACLKPLWQQWQPDVFLGMILEPWHDFLLEVFPLGSIFQVHPGWITAAI